MGRPKSKKLPYFAELLVILFKNQEKRKITLHKWGNEIKNLNTIYEILITSSGDDDLNKWWSEKKDNDINHRGFNSTEVYNFKAIGSVNFKYISENVCKYYQRVPKEEAVDKLEKTLCDDRYKINDVLNKELCLDILKIFKNSNSLKQAYYVTLLESLIFNNEFKLFFAYVLYHMASKFIKFETERYDFENLSKSNSYALRDLMDDLNNGVFYDSVDRKVILLPNPEEEIIEATTVTKITTKRLSSKVKNADYLVFSLGFEHEKLRNFHRVENVIINGVAVNDKDIQIETWENEESKNPYKKKYTIKNIKQSSVYEIETTSKSILNFPVGEIVYRLKMATHKFKFVAKISELNKKHRNNFKLSGIFLGSFKFEDRIRFIEATNHYFKVEIDDCTTVGSGVRLIVRPYNKFLKYDY